MTVLISGGFDPLHVGHLELIELASSYIDYGGVIVALNSDDWLVAKKGYVFMTWLDRAKILRSMRKVAVVIPAMGVDGTISDTLESIQPNFFVNGGDHMEPNTKEHSVCVRLGIVEIFGGAKVRSSQMLVEATK